MSMVEVKVPDIGDFKEVEVIEVMVKPGERIRQDQSLVMVESDKASMEIPSSHAGIVKELKVKLGDKVSEGTLLLLLEEEGAGGKPSAPAASAPARQEQTSIPQAAAPSPAPAAQPSPAVPPSTEAATPPGFNPHASPSIRRFARELGVDLARVRGSGPKGRILREDVQNFVKAAISGAPGVGIPAVAHAGTGHGLDLLPWPPLDFSRFGPTELMPLSRIKKISGPNLHRNWVMIPHVTQYEDADVTELEAFRLTSNEKLKQEGVKLTMLAFVIKACVAALKRYPQFNSSMDEAGENLIVKHYYHIGFAADTVHGLVVPVVKDADKKGVAEIAREMGELSAQAREGKLNPSDMQGASFTITSLGGIGGTYFTPLINAPEVAIVGLSRLTMKPTWDGKQFVPRLILPLSLSYDHRVIDGAEGTRFTTYLAEILGDMRKTLL